MKACNQIRARALDALMQQRRQPADVVEHCAVCTDCRHELAALEDVWLRLGRLEQRAPSPESTNRIAARLQEAAHGNTEKGQTMRTSWLVAALLAGLLLGAAGGAGIARRAEPAAVPSGGMFLLLLHEGIDSDAAYTAAQMDSIVNEYRNWANRLASEDRLVSAEKLSNDVRWATPAAASHPATQEEHVSGFFLIRARDYDEAVSIAQQSPHIRYGGTIEVRAIEHTSGGD
jgi:hypothetical protein